MVFKLVAFNGATFVLKILYFTTKINGLLPITITFHPLVASNSLNDVLYSALYTVLVIAGTPYVQSIVIESVGILNNPKRTIILVFFAQVSASALRLGAIYLSQVFNYKNLSSFINRSVQIHEMFAQKNDQKTFMDHKMLKWCRYKFASTILQIILMLVPSVGFMSIIRSSERFLVLAVSFFCILYTHVVLIFTTGIYFAVMIVIGQFYRNLNAQLVGMQKKCSVAESKMQNLCDLSDECDRLTVLYRTITNHATDFIKCQRCFTTFSLAQYFVIILAEMFDVYTQIMRTFSLNVNVTKNSLFTQLLKEFGFFGFYAIELYYTIRVASFVQNEVRKTWALLRLCNRPSYDIRLRRSIEALSLHILVHTPKMSVCGLFGIDNSLLFGMIATFASYLIILVQFVEDEDEPRT